MKHLSNIIAIIFVSLLVGVLFFISGVIGSLSIESWENPTIRVFTYIGLLVGGVVGTLGLWWHEKGKIDGKG